MKENTITFENEEQFLSVCGALQMTHKEYDDMIAFFKKSRIEVDENEEDTLE